MIKYFQLMYIEYPFSIRKCLLFIFPIAPITSYNYHCLYILNFNQIDVFKDTDFNKSNHSHEFENREYNLFFNINFSFQPSACDGSHNM